MTPCPPPPGDRCHLCPERTRKRLSHLCRGLAHPAYWSCIIALLPCLYWGPLPIGYHGLGDLFVFLFFGGAAVCGTYYVQVLSISSMVVAAYPSGLADSCYPGNQQPARYRVRPANGKADACGHDRVPGNSTGVRAFACIGLRRIVASLACRMVASMDLVALAFATPRRASRACYLSER